MATLVMSKKVLFERYSEQDLSPMAVCYSEVGPGEITPIRAVFITTDLFTELGEPIEITVAIEAGDQVNL